MTTGSSADGARGDAGARFVPAEAEPRWIAAWQDSGALDVNPGGDAPGFAIAIPPPNVTGALHMGHALNNTIQDVLIRRRRMAADEVKWIFGTDHAGIATQKKVEEQLAAEGTDRWALGREKFLERVWEWKEQYGGRITHQLRSLGCTLDYAGERFTMDEDYAAAVQRVFCDLHEKGHIFRGDYLVNWDPGLGTAISDLEVEMREVTDAMVEIAYPLSDGGGEVVVATVRPETMLGDTAVAVSPEDDRYRGLIGRTCTLPLVGREIPIVADQAVDPEFGTGALKVTPAHSGDDFEIAQRHDLPPVSVIGEDGRMTDEAGKPYAGLTPEECARKVVEDLRAAGVLRSEREYTHEVPYSHRSGERVQPLISLQWFADMDALAEPAIAAVRDGRVRFTPERFADVYLTWMENIRPWCLSRQLWWGHRLPVWYRGEEVYVGVEAPEGEGWKQDPDVLDTWFSSALWPFATLGWPESTDQLGAFYPTQVLSTARDIIFLWVARMVMMGLEYMDDVPFSDVYIHSVVQAPDGRRMSKSLGTGIDPEELISQHGADALRFGLLMMSSTQDVRFSHDRISQGRQLVTKLWNVGRLVVDRGGRLAGESPRPETVADRWMASRLTAAIEESDEALGGFRFSQLADGIYHLVFDDYCDGYLELLKAGEATPEVAAALLEQILALLGPVMPFVAEEVWAQLPGAQGMMIGHAPPRALGDRDHEAEEAVERLKETVTALRSYASERGLPRRSGVSVWIDGDGAPSDHTLRALAGAEPTGAPPEGASVVGLSFGRMHVAPAGGVDRDAELARLQAAIDQADAEISRAERQLANERFVERAPAELVDQERAKLQRYTDERAALVAERAT
ncbi:MAG: valine--tRNA ligase, partial [Miltoncostaeaceae bacterium]